jgi:hypothetical protein
MVYTLQQAQYEIATLRGVVAHLLVNATFANLSTDGTLNVGFGANLAGRITFNPQIVGLGGFLPTIDTDTTSNSVTQSSLTRVTTSWSIPASDAIIGTTYRFTAWGTGTQGSTAQTLGFAIVAFGVTFGTSRFPTSFAGINTAFGWMLNGIIQVTNTGTGTANVTCQLVVSITAAGSSGGNFLNGFSTTTAGTTSSTEPMYIECIWGSTTGAPTVTCTGSMIERLGN